MVRWGQKRKGEKINVRNIERIQKTEKSNVRKMEKIQDIANLQICALIQTNEVITKTNRHKKNHTS